jgi:hypothetical protein
VVYYEWWTIRNLRTTLHTCYMGGTNEEKKLKLQTYSSQSCPIKALQKEMEL